MTEREVAEQIILATGGDLKRVLEAAEVIRIYGDQRWSAGYARSFEVTQAKRVWP